MYISLLLRMENEGGWPVRIRKWLNVVKYEHWYRRNMGAWSRQIYCLYERWAPLSSNVLVCDSLRSFINANLMCSTKRHSEDLSTKKSWKRVREKRSILASKQIKFRLSLHIDEHRWNLHFIKIWRKLQQLNNNTAYKQRSIYSCKAYQPIGIYRAWQ